MIKELERILRDLDRIINKDENDTSEYEAIGDDIDNLLTQMRQIEKALEEIGRVL